MQGGPAVARPQHMLGRALHKEDTDDRVEEIDMMTMDNRS
jgi:hypothetical protein